MRIKAAQIRQMTTIRVIVASELFAAQLPITGNRSHESASFFLLSKLSSLGQLPAFALALELEPFSLKSIPQ